MSIITNSPGISDDAIIEATIPASSSLDVDTVEYSDFESIRYLMRLFNTSQAKRRYFELKALKQSSGDVSDIIDSVFGDALDVDTQVLKSGTDMVVRMTNSESFDVSLRAKKSII